MANEPKATGGESLLVAEGLHLTYGPTVALAGASIVLGAGDTIGVTGRSGSGKSSLLYCLAGIVRPDAGRVAYAGRDLSTGDDDELSEIRRRDFGFVFQFGELVPELSLHENVSLPLRLNRVGRAETRERTLEIVEMLGITDCAHKRPGEVSGGQAQRAAVARALVHRPRVIFADEPTGSLDTENSEKVLGAFIDLARARGTTVVLVTHEPAIAAICDRHVDVVDGRVRDARASVLL